MSVTHGMDVGEVRRLGGSLQSKADQLDALIKDVDRSVGGSSWVGPDAVMFKTQWWPERKAQLLRASQDLHGLGQSALNNAEEQDRASDVSPRGEGSAGVIPNEGGSDAATPPNSATPPASPGASDVGVSGGNLEAEFVKDWQVGGNEKSDAWNFLRPPAGTGNCTSYAAWRLNDLAEENGLDWSMTNNHVGDTRLPRLGNADEWAANADAAGIPVDNQPSAGAVAQWDVSDRMPDGHVAIVRSVDADTGAITIEESSWGGKVFNMKTINPGDAGYPDNFIHMLPGS